MKYHDTRAYKYRVAETERILVPEFVEAPEIRQELFRLHKGVLTVYPGYSWDGASGPTWDTEETMTPSLAHDVLYQSIRTGLLPSSFRFLSDLAFYRLMRARTKTFFGHFRAFYFFLGVRVCGFWSTRPKPDGEEQDIVHEVD